MSRGTGSRSALNFSVAVLVRDEGSSLPRLLRGLGPFLERDGEVLVVDTGSTDDTVAVARSHGCRVEQVNGRFDQILDPSRAAEICGRFARDGEGPLVTAGQRLFHFGDARQHAGQIASSGFVLQLDGSDEVPALDLDALDRWIASGAGVFEYEQQYGNVSLRISRFYDRARYRWEGRVHERLSPNQSGAAATASAIRCDPAQLLVRHHKDEGKTRNYLAGLAIQVLERPEQPRWWHYLGRELRYAGWYRSAVEVLEAHAAMASAWSPERSQSLCFAGECFEVMEQPEQALDAYRRALALEASRREPLLKLAALHCRRGEFDAAAEHALRSLDVPKDCAYPELEANYAWVPHSILYWCLFWLGRGDQAREQWEIYRSLAPAESLIDEHARLFPPAASLAR